MNESGTSSNWSSSLRSAFKTATISLGTFLLLTGAYFSVELAAYELLKPTETLALAFGLTWSVLLACICMLFPRKASRIFFGITYFILTLWMLAQCGYHQVFGKLMWVSTISFAGEGATFLGDVIASFPALWWVFAASLIGLGVLIIVLFPKVEYHFWTPFPCILACAAMISNLMTLPETLFLKDNEIWGTHSEYARSSSYEASYETMYDAKIVYNMCGIYHLTYRDLWKHEIYPLTPDYQSFLNEQTQKLDAYFEERGTHTDNEMTGIFEGKNVVLVLMESMDDWMITPEDTPTLYSMMEEGIHFTDFYTPGYGSARTFNTEFCMNSGIYLPTTGGYVFDYVTNSYDQSIASLLSSIGYNAEVFHYNEPSFYSRGVFEPAFGYNAYHTYEDYVKFSFDLYDDCLVFDIPELSDLFFRKDTPTFNTIITRSAHLSYVYNEVISNYALRQYPEYRGKYGSEEEDCARVKAKLVDDMFARLLTELSARGQLDNTVIIGITDHYTYGYKNEAELYALSGVSEQLLLEKTPCFIWSTDCPSIQVEKTMQTADFLPTVLNLMGIDNSYNYLGQDVFDPNYQGYALFPNGSWISNGIACNVDSQGQYQIIANETGTDVEESTIQKMAQISQKFIEANNMLLSSNYYQADD